MYVIGFIWNPSNCECECDKCDIGEYLDYSNCKCRRKLVDPLAEEWMYWKYWKNKTS